MYAQSISHSLLCGKSVVMLGCNDHQEVKLILLRFKYISEESWVITWHLPYHHGDDSKGRGDGQYTPYSSSHYTPHHVNRAYSRHGGVHGGQEGGGGDKGATPAACLYHCNVHTIILLQTVI